MARIGILTVIEEEFEEVSKMLGATANVAGTGYYLRPGQQPENCDIVVASFEGRGNIKATSGTIALVEDFQPAYVLLVGIAGGMAGRDNTCVGDVIVPDFIDQYEMRKLVQGKSLRRHVASDHPSHALRNFRAVPIARSKTWQARIIQGRPDDDGLEPKVLSGMLISGEKVLGDDTADYQREIMGFFDSALAVDMESWGVASAIYSSRTTRHYNPQYLVIRGISDVLHPLPSDANANAVEQDRVSNNEMRQRWKRYAANAAAAFAAELIDQLVAIPD